MKLWGGNDTSVSSCGVVIKGYFFLENYSYAFFLRNSKQVDASSAKFTLRFFL